MFSSGGILKPFRVRGGFFSFPERFFQDHRKMLQKHRLYRGFTGKNIIESVSRAFPGLFGLQIQGPKEVQKGSVHGSRKNQSRRSGLQS